MAIRIAVRTLDSSSFFPPQIVGRGGVVLPLRVKEEKRSTSKNCRAVRTKAGNTKEEEEQYVHSLVHLDALIVGNHARHLATLPSRKSIPMPAMIRLPTGEPGWCARAWFNAYIPVAHSAPVPMARHERQSADTRRDGNDEIW